jgi:hypothetical protein
MARDERTGNNEKERGTGNEQCESMQDPVHAFNYRLPISIDFRLQLPIGNRPVSFRSLSNRGAQIGQSAI